MFKISGTQRAYQQGIFLYIQYIWDSKSIPTRKENLFPGNSLPISSLALSLAPIHKTPLLLLNLWRRTLMKCSWEIRIKQTEIATTYSRWDCVECKDFRNVGDLFHPLGPAKASFSAAVCMTIPCAFLHDYKFDQVL